MKKKYMPYAIFDAKGEIVGFEPDTPQEALDAVKAHIEMSKHFCDVPNYDWDEKLKKLGIT